MTDEQATPAPEHAPSTILEFGGLRFDVSFRGRGATLRVEGNDGTEWTELLRFDDFLEGPHFHAPPADQFPFDRALGEPLAWYIAQVRDHLAEWLTRAGFGDHLGTVDFEEVTANADKIEHAMIDCVPAGFVRTPGYGLQLA